MKDRDVITTNSFANTTLGWFSDGTGASVDDGARKSSNRVANWQRKSRLVLSASFPVVNWRSRSVAKTAHPKVACKSRVCMSCDVTIFCSGGRKGGGALLPEKLGGVVRDASWNPYPISDKNLWFFLPYFKPDQKFDTLFQTWPLNQYPISDLPYNQFLRSDQC